MGSSCSCSDKDSVPDDHQSKFKVINVDDDGNELGSGVMELTQEELVLHTRKHHTVRWPYLCLRRYGYDSNLFSFESGRCCQTGQGIFAFKCTRAEEIFNLLQDVMHSNSINVVEEPVQEAEPPHLPPISGYTTAVSNGTPLASVGDGSLQQSTLHPSMDGTHLPLLGEDSSNTMFTNEVHTYVNTTGVQDKFHTHPPVEVLSSEPEDVALLNETEAQVLLEPKGVKFVLGPTPVQRQLMAKVREQEMVKVQQGRSRVCREETVPPPGSPAELDTGYDSDERKDTPQGCKLAHEHHGSIGPPPATSPDICIPAQHRNSGLPGHTAHVSSNSGQRKPDNLNFSSYGQRRTAQVPALPPLWEAPKPSSEEQEEGSEEFVAKTPLFNGNPQHHSTEHSHNYVNTENVTAPPSARKLDVARHCSAPAVFRFDLRQPGPDTVQQLHYIEVEMERGSGSSSPNTPCTPTTPFLQTSTRRMELYAIIDIERTAAMSSLQKAMPWDDGMSRKTRHNSIDVPT
ncbi:fibroblast growth factor receptor substrate 2-like [Scleropages formosus]|uniref:Fibroblast growth factor receptor substrate 2 n=1 Tax=Scleropages formosus TaxID=113540 RepID=A0A8C9UY54_SCLFO|nr:fibroblast growth factor receptor substrate 2-like [Scleropages formosus]XP_018585537.1 fibroblast growth factor receptor substrate 2-like [Scleropages formosus]XP_018585538.1 fibroblast growth factor receptor substrate 2-like [Scleropages formosus]XP_018585539.1 fibroblast growth factor receptor substrate 2-like [Scleropages formosus]